MWYEQAENRTMSIKALQKEVLALARGQVEGSDMKALKRLFKEKVGLLWCDRLTQVSDCVRQVCIWFVG